MAGPIQRTGMTIFRLVSFYPLFKSGAGFPAVITNEIHLLAHRADITVLFLVIKKLIRNKGELTVMVFILLLVKHAILYKSGGLFFFKQCVIFFRAIPRICGNYFRGLTETGLMLRYMCRERSGICRVGVNGIINNELIGCGDLHIITRL